ncbi:hypothetical protein RhiirA5_355128 [Rhizophagus irregularis]|nr:hypothetical protein GLOIN_2v1521507 [Rhizophagus irregularis DAOM 181602=DAOM 197198]PKC10748.1 hypothetical protein RhiirA5_355128 [Rhizophagus irregularis]PKC71811.1 hypothetical protein RhiirA1_412680 [Rhizophagus irregularis]PKK78238.1 hypothetical protein RhiirC2_730335 [Rhizophagus irregularis]PKY24120.1 hypothetical protein RhiirB3_412679 [Rhizophagus irregularis]POG80097.1 hypothetical protein GLOIN_2v1521507 [Rhizophagus irregularis DAOM 181602=DAOM 197198]|eukprot:XP_025186963.1 hypothetical protein GLOIN_2v1521507 [Rhizophagus irregularis DAOM 181602=DAOM 197198]
MELGNKYCNYFLDIYFCIPDYLLYFILFLDALAIIDIIKSNRRTMDKFLWSLLIMIFQVFGLVAYFFASDRQRYQESSWYQAIP